MDTARKAAKKILGAYPDYGKAPPEYIIGFAEALSHLTADEVQIVMDPKHGVAARCQFLPTIADVHAAIKARREFKEQFKPAHTNYHRLNDQPSGPWDQETDFERKKRVVLECLGYNPDQRGAASANKRTFTQPSVEDVKNLKLKTPAAKPSSYLIAQLKAEGWPLLLDEAAAKGETH